MVNGDGEGKGMEKRRGMVKGRAYLGPRHRSLGILDPRCCLRVCVPVCRCWAVSPHRHHMWHGRVVVLCWHHVVVGPCCLLIIVACLLSSHVWSCRCCGSSLSSVLLCCPCCIVVQCRRPCLATSSLCHVLPCV